MVPDVDGDGVDDLFAVAAGRAWLVSGASGETLSSRPASAPISALQWVPSLGTVLVVTRRQLQSWPLEGVGVPVTHDVSSANWSAPVSILPRADGVLLAAAESDMKRLDRQLRRRIRTALYRLDETSYGDVRRVKGTEDELRLRVGTVRVRFRFTEPQNDVLVLRVLPRDKAYR